MSQVLSCTQIEAQVLARGACCMPGCPNRTVVAHRIIAPLLWQAEACQPDNLAALCAEHALAALRTEITPAQLRLLSGIKSVVQPPQFEDDEVIDTWGNPVLPNGTRLRGEAFFDDVVQQHLTAAGLLPIFTHWVKHSKTWHTPDSPGVTKGDRVLPNMNHFVGKRTIMTEKRDGECTTLYPDYMHARSLDSRHHPSRNRIKQFWSAVRGDIPQGHRVVAENMVAKHSIGYSDVFPLEGYFMWDDRNRALSWDDTLEWFALIGSSAGLFIPSVPVLLDGIYDPQAITARWQQLLADDADTAARTGQPVQQREGYVLRLADGFAYSQFRACVAKWVRPAHVQTDTHWMHGEVIENGMKMFGHA